MTRSARYSSLELYRIIVMLAIVAHHYVVNSGLMTCISGGMTCSKFFLLCFGGWGKVGINCFVLITGYFMCMSNITLKKFLKLYLEVVFYSVVLNSIFAITLLIHANSDAMRRWLWGDVCNVVGWYNAHGDSVLLIAGHAIGCVVAIFTICAIIDLLRQRFVEKSLFARGLEMDIIPWLSPRKEKA